MPRKIVLSVMRLNSSRIGLDRRAICYRSEPQAIAGWKCRMDELIGRIAKETGLEPAKAEQAVGIMLGLVKTQGTPAKVGELFDKMPGADELVQKFGGDGAGRGGLLGMLGGGLMGGPLAAISKLSAAGLGMEEIKQVGSLTLGYAKEKAGVDLVRDVAGSIPGIGGYL